MTSAALKTLAIFAKYWTPGRVKTRLAKSIGDLAAAQVYRCFLEHSLRNLEGCTDKTVVGYWPPESRAEFVHDLGQWGLAHTIEFQVQSSGDLGTRMREHFKRQFADGATHAVLIGSDCPTVCSRTIKQALNALQTFDVVLGPSEDGGYFLIGMKQPHDNLFEGIDWSTDRVLEQTMSKIKQNGISVHQLETMNDIDEMDDLEKLLNQLNNSPHATEQSLLDDLRQILSTPGGVHEV